VTLISNWEEVLKKAWSVRFGILATVFASMEAFFTAMEGVIPGLPQGLLAGVGATLAAAGIVARILDQTKKDAEPSV
jgi:hypothetical protein